MYFATRKNNATKKSGGSRREARYGNDRTESVFGRYHGDKTKSSKHPRSGVHRIICREKKNQKNAIKLDGRSLDILLVTYENDKELISNNKLDRRNTRRGGNNKEGRGPHSRNHRRAEVDGGRRPALTAEQLDAELDAFMSYIKEVKRGKRKTVQ
ncbi:hypothetical protein HW555_001008 [Spodoptera exigua]|uniref:Chromatin target of PRMT1 protein C-terminal domain-containing protein n=1 Tax=Spodoptera exigua TaxID=7107 RepID=A0A835GSA1_SPOEX|nr:hypothetical protein HW555_001008 [Spodoptera exigua]